MASELKLEVEIIWDDIDFFEVAVTASNNHFSGFTKVYAQEEQMLTFADKIQNFPQSTSDVALLELEQGDSFLGLKVFCYDNFGHTEVKVDLKYNSRDHYKTEVGNASFYLPCFPEQLKRFGQQIVKMLRDKQGEAIL